MNQSGAGKILLVVDPCQETQSLALEQATVRGLSVITAPDPHVAMAMLDMALPDVVLSDPFMPDMAGLAMIRTMHERYPHIAKIIMAKDGDENSIVEALRAGAVDYLHKPVLGEELGLAFDRALQTIPQTIDDVPGIELFEYRQVIGNDPLHVESCVSWLIQGTAMTLPETQRLHLRATLIELLVNAVEHGSLEIFYQEKHEALAKGQFEALIAQRRADPRFAKRRVIVRACYDKHARLLRYAIQDEGRGFAWKPVLTGADEPCESHDANGRGVFLAKAFFPNLTYNEQGNEVMFSVPLP
ncbi:MAG: putative Response regulator with ATPase domain [Nitrospira sp.]|jgi:CheY-like chemotaxis protein|nr:putative Response regulator with ATPase domain [Nitrospira sp.]